MRTVITMQGMPAQTMESRLISKGREKNITELKSPLVNMKIVRNGDQLSITDLKTGAVLPSQTAPQTAVPDINQGMGSAEDYLAPAKEGNLWRLSPKDPAKATLFYSEELKRVVKIQHTVQPGVYSETNIKYCDKTCSFPGTPVSIEIETYVNGQAASKVLLEIISIQKVSSLSDALFAIPKK
ncbi:MAG: hypothetical protein LBQ76_09160 [Candidatus Fibromonas sp.]|jgi:hypothetical protein|nr:hypothetical protein [Candidatus Fibromonas sp.]